MSALLVTIGIGAGQLLASSEEALVTVPILLVLVPAINAASGMVGAVLGARVATGLHTGSLLSKGALQFRRDVAATIIIGAVTFGVLGVAAIVGAEFMGLQGATLLADLALVLAGTGVFLVVGMILIVILVGTLSFRLGWDPDNIVVPVVTTAGDLLGVTSFILMVQWVGL